MIHQTNFLSLVITLQYFFIFLQMSRLTTLSTCAIMLSIEQALNRLKEEKYASFFHHREPPMLGMRYGMDAEMDFPRALSTGISPY